MTKQITRLTQHEPPSAELIEAVLLAGDLSRLTPDQRLHYYKSVCDTLGLNSLTKPFDYITLDGKLVLYARKDCTEQLRKIYNISLTIKSRETNDNVYAVVAQAQLPNMRVDEAIGAVPLEVMKDGKVIQLSAAAKANNMMKAETKAKRRVTLSICGLGIMDESEIELAEMTAAEFTPVEREPAAITERNVKEATANATGEVPPEKENPVTIENYKDVVCHVGKAEGTILGKKIGDIHPKIIDWLVEKWIPKLAAVPSDKDARLRDAIMLAKEHPREGEGTPEQLAKADEAMKGNGINVERSKMLNDLRNKIEELVMTPKQFMGYLQLAGFNLNEGQHTIFDLTDNQLQFLMMDWEVTKASIESAVKPKVDETVAKPKKRKKATGDPEPSPFDR